jgi:integrase
MNAGATVSSDGVLSKQHSNAGGGSVTERIERYTPEIPLDYWNAIEEFVRSCVADAQPTTAYSVKALLGALTQLARWAWQLGYELERRVVLDRFTIEEFIATGCPTTWSNASRGNCRSQLFRISEALLGADARTPRLIPMSTSAPSKPYDAQEIVALRSWADGQVTPTRRRDALMLLSLCAGAGLATEDLLALRVRDIQEVLGCLLVNVTGRRARQTAVLAQWEEKLADILSSMSPDTYVFRTLRTTEKSNAVTNFVSEASGTNKPNSQRLRATWIVHHLSVATPVNVLMSAAGVRSLEALTRYVQFVPGIEASEVRARLRGDSTKGELH